MSNKYKGNSAKLLTRNKIKFGTYRVLTTRNNTIITQFVKVSLVSNHFKPYQLESKP